MRRRDCLGWALGAALPARAAEVLPRRLVFPADHGAHPDFRTEWWYVTGLLWEGAGEPAIATRPRYGFQLTFFRSRTDLAADNPSRFAARQLLFAHAALTDLAGGRLLHAERIVRWTGDAAAARAAASLADTDVFIADWRLARSGPPDRGAYAARFGDRDAGFGCTLDCTPTQPLLLQGDQGVSRKGPHAAQASYYYSRPQLAVAGELSLGARTQPVRGRAWLDHEWSETLMDPQAVGWDWCGINLDDGGALTAFRLRRTDGSVLWAGGSHRDRDGRQRHFAPGDVVFTPGRRWTSPHTGAAYPVEWTLQTPVGRFALNALADAQELDSRRSTGSVYWEGASELRVLDAAGTPRVGWGYLEMTGVVSPLRLG